MLKGIFLDYIDGILQSLKIHLFFKLLLTNKNFYNLIIKLLKFNLTLHIFPTLIINIIIYYFNFNAAKYMIYPFLLLNSIFYSLYYNDFLAIVYPDERQKCIYVNPIVITILIMCYQLSIYLGIVIVDYLFYNNFYLLSVIINIFLLSIYYSFYCYNNIFNYNNINLSTRIKLIENIWPYYLGYGTNISILYYFTDNFYILIVHNIYLLILLTIVLIIPFKCTHQNYPPIKLDIFSSLLSFILKTINYFLIQKNEI